MRRRARSTRSLDGYIAEQATLREKYPMTQGSPPSQEAMTAMRGSRENLNTAVGKVLNDSQRATWEATMAARRPPGGGPGGPPPACADNLAVEVPTTRGRNAASFFAALSFWAFRPRWANIPQLIPDATFRRYFFFPLRLPTMVDAVSHRAHSPGNAGFERTSRDASATALDPNRPGQRHCPCHPR